MVIVICSDFFFPGGSRRKWLLPLCMCLILHHH